MNSVVMLLAYLVLALLGFVMPAFAILLTLYNDGMRKLSIQYKREKEQAGTKLKDQLKESGKQDEINIAAIQSNINELERIERTAARKVLELDPKRQVRDLSLLLAGSFVVLLLLVQFGPGSRINEIIGLGCCGLAIGIFVYKFRSMLSIIVEVRELLDAEQRLEREKLVETIGSVTKGVDLAAQVALEFLKKFEQNSADSKKETHEIINKIAKEIERSSNNFLVKVFPEINRVRIEGDLVVVPLQINIKNTVPIAIHNDEIRMAKNVEMGIIFPLDFLIEKTDYYTLFSGSANQVVRFSDGMLQGLTYRIFQPLLISPLKKGKFIVDVFIKAENIEARTKKLTFEVN